MRILWFTNTPSLASNLLGIENVSGGWIESLERELNDRHNITLGVAFYAKVKRLKIICNKNVTYYVLPQSNNIVRWFKKVNGQIENPKKEIPKFKTIINDFNPDIIHIFGTENPFCHLIEHFNIPVLVHIQGFVHKIFDKFSIGFSDLELLKYSDINSIIKGNSPFFRKKIYQKMAIREINYLKKIKYVDGRTTWDRNIIRQTAKQAIYFHCDELLKNDFNSTEWQGGNTGKKVIVSILSNEIYKGFFTIVKTAEILKRKANFDFVWKIIGISKSHNSTKMVQKIINSKINELNVDIVGRKDARDIASLLSKSDLFALASYIENSPNTLCEAMQIGIPIVSTNVGGIPSLLKDNYEGLLVEPNNEQQLSHAIMKILSNPDIAHEYSINGRRRAQKRHDKDEVINNLLSIYNKIQNTK